MTIRVVLVDDHAIVRTGLKAVLGAAPEIEVVGEASGGVEAVALLARTPADVVVMDISMAEGDGIAATRAIVATGSYGPKGYASEWTVPQGAEEADGIDSMARTGRKRVEAEFSVTAKIDRTEALYRRLLAAKRPA